jgi:hypothetical protein
MSAPRYWFWVITSISAADAVPASANKVAVQSDENPRFIAIPSMTDA